MHSQNIHIDLLSTHLSEYGISGLLPQNLSETLLSIISAEFNNLQSDNKEEGNEAIAILLTAVLCLIRGDTSPFDNTEPLEVSSDVLFDQMNNYGLSIAIEEIRRSGLMKISEENLPTISNILDDDRDLVATGDYDAIQDFLGKFKN